MICFDVNDKCDDDATENHDEDYLEVYDENLGSFLKEAVSKDTNVFKEEKHDYDETSGEDSVNLFNIERKEDEIHGSQETLDEGIANDNEEVL